MLTFTTMTTPIRIQKKTSGSDADGFANETWTDIIDEDILCEWTNKFGDDLYQAAAVKAKEPAKLRMWYLPGVTADCRIIRIDDESIEVEENPIFEIVGNPDDVKNRHQQLEIQVKRYIAG